MSGHRGLTHASKLQPGPWATPGGIPSVLLSSLSTENRLQLWGVLPLSGLVKGDWGQVEHVRHLLVPSRSYSQTRSSGPPCHSGVFVTAQEGPLVVLGSNPGWLRAFFICSYYLFGPYFILSLFSF